MESVIEHPKYSSSRNNPPVQVRSSTPVIDLTNHYGLVAIVVDPFQRPEIYERMHDIYWGLYAERIARERPHTHAHLL